MGKIISKLLVICGPTATGKTKLAFDMAKKFNGELISADSRMVYKYMDIGTGKDIKKYGKIFGYDLVNPNEEFSISNYSRFARKAINEIQKREHLPILVGGSGLYIKSVISDITTISVAPDKKLRKKLEIKTVDELFEKLLKINPERAKSMNDSDRRNPRRLIRAIEIAKKEPESNFIKYDVLFVGLTANKEILKKRIGKRVDERINNGFEEELNFLKKKDFFRYVPSRTLGYKDWLDIEKWKLEEFKYAKRQMTWFKKESQINWFDITTAKFEKDVEKLIQKWYSDTNAAQS